MLKPLGSNKNCDVYLGKSLSDDNLFCFKVIKNNDE